MVQTIDETRRLRLQLLIQEHGTIAELNAAMGMDRTDATFSQIRNQAVHSTSGKPRAMGDDLARKIEVVLGKPRGWMDTPPGMEYINEPGPMRDLHRVAEQLEPYQIEQLAAIGITLARGGLTKTNAKPELTEESGQGVHTDPAGSGAGKGPTPVKTATARRGGLFDPAIKTPRGQVDERSNDGGIPRKGHARRGR
jgi:hypothetical protein